MKKVTIWKKNTLQLQITGIVGLILLTACLLLTANSLFSAHNYYDSLLEAGLIERETYVSDTTPPVAYDSDITHDSDMESGTNPGYSSDPYSASDPQYGSDSEYSADMGYDPDMTYQDVSSRFSRQSVVFMAVIVLFALAATYWAVGKMLRPLKRLIHSVQTTDDYNLDHRVDSTGAQGEVLVLNEAYNDMLERLEEAFLIQKSFAANAAHELKTPLAVIKSSLQVLEMMPAPKVEDYREFMDDTDKSLNRIIKTVEGLLALANLAEVPVQQKVELSSLLEQAVQELSLKASAAEVEVHFQNDTPMFTKGSPDLLYRAFYNLIENAVKYNLPGGKVLITLKKENGKACIRIKDNGIGIEADALPHIYEPFYRADQSRSQKIPGSGLGLAVVKMITEKHKGEIKTESEPGKGAAFTILLDLSLSPTAEIQQLKTFCPDKKI